MSNTKVILGDISEQEMSNLHDPYTQYYITVRYWFNMIKIQRIYICILNWKVAEFL